MAKRKGLSLEEKRSVVQHFLWETKGVYNLKELEKEAGRRGVVEKTVEEVVKSLVDDRFVECEKIGSGNFYWSFPSKAFVQKKSNVEALQKRCAEDTKAAGDLQARIQELTSSRAVTPDRTAKEAELAKLKAEKEALERELKAFADSDPAAYKAVKERIGGAKQAADRWTDNVFALKSHLVNKFGKEPREVDSMMNIKDDFDYVA